MRVCLVCTDLVFVCTSSKESHPTPSSAAESTPYAAWIAAQGLPSQSTIQRPTRHTSARARLGMYERRPTPMRDMYQPAVLDPTPPGSPLEATASAGLRCVLGSEGRELRCESGAAEGVGSQRRGCTGLGREERRCLGRAREKRSVVFIYERAGDGERDPQEPRRGPGKCQPG